ncbi:MAG: glycosyltransferase family 2 protein [Fibrobacter sp.]|jgi:GT2 family glycosyltransferase|nr:glycosyltransferase family 2 protein [Fibrobacter sp.]
MEKSLSCSVIIIAYNSGDFIPACLNSIRKALEGMDSQIIVLDNGSPEPLSQECKDFFPQVKWLHSETNLGFGKGCNYAAKYAEKENLFFINPDTIVAQDTFRKTLSYMLSLEKPGLVGCQILNENGTFQLACRRTFPSPLAAIFKTIGLARLFPKSRFFASYNMTYLDPDQNTEVDAVSGSFFCIRKSLFENIGGFDEDFFMYGEDLDICLRVKKLGYENHYYAGAKIIHFKGKSSATRRLKTYLNFYKAMFIFAEKHRYYRIPLPFVTLGIFFASCVGAFSRLIPQWWKMLLDAGAVFLSVFLLSKISPDFEMRPVVVSLSVLMWCVFALGGDYSTPRLDGKGVWRFLFPLLLVFSAVLVLMGKAPLLMLSFALAIGLFALIWRRFIFWGYYFYRVFFRLRHRSILFGASHHQLSPYFRFWSEELQSELLGCVAPSREQILEKNRTYFLGALSEMDSICRRTGCRELLLVSDSHGYYEDLDRNWARALRLKVLLLICSRNFEDFVLVDLENLYS